MSERDRTGKVAAKSAGKTAEDEQAEAPARRVVLRHSWREPNSWAEVTLMRVAGLVSLWLASGALSFGAGVARRRLVAKRGRRLAKNTRRND